MAQSITLMGATYPDVPSILLPKSTSGMAQFDDTTIASNAASASDIASGKLAWVNGSLLTGTGSGGGGGLVYETGEYKPSSNVAQPTINFANTHSDRPFIVLIEDVGGSSLAQTDSALYWEIFSFYDAFGVTVYTNTTNQHYARVQYAYKSSSSSTASGTNVTALSGTYSSAMPYHLSNTSFKPYMGSTSRYFRSGRTYKWIAVWKP